MARTHLLFKGAVLSAATQYVPLPISGGTIGAQIAWLDATSSATLTIETSNYDANDAPLTDAGSAWEWKGSGLTITGPTGAAAGSTTLNIENVRQKRARLKIVAAANCLFEVTDGEVVTA
jgi:hypothetical protein